MAAAVSAAGVLDVVLALTTLWVAWRSLASRDLFQAIVLFVVFGVLMALVWLRLAAPDVALAEAAVGAGLTGVLLIETLSRIRGGEEADPIDLPPPLRAALVGTPLALLAAALVAVGLAGPRAAAGLAALVGENMDHSGVENAVTAVLLNFRGYDTLLEIAVLFAAVLVSSYGMVERRPPVPVAVPDGGDLMLEWFVRRMVPLGMMIVAYLWWRGATDPAGAFQAGTVLAALLVLLVVTGFRPVPSPAAMRTRLWVAGGLATFVAVGCFGLLGGWPFLTLPEAWAGALILGLEAALTIGIGVSLATLVVGLRERP